MSTDTEQDDEFVLDLRIGNYQVKRTDIYNITVQEVKLRKDGDNVGTEYFTNIGYYKTLGKALEKVLRLTSEKGQITTITKAIEVFKEAENNLLRILQDEYPKFDI